MAEGTTYQGGMADVARGLAEGDDGQYKDFVAYEVTPSARITVVTVSGRVRVGNLGIKAVLRYAEPQGTDGSALLLRIDFIQRPGIWPAVMTWVPAIYVGTFLNREPYREAQIVSGNLIVVTVPFIR